jgi:multidrug efflux system outer membrane protein
LSACTLGPNYQRPAIESPAAWRVDYAQAADVANARWWQQFGDPVLDKLSRMRLRGNLDWARPAARVRALPGALEPLAAQLFPQLRVQRRRGRNRSSRVGVTPDRRRDRPTRSTRRQCRASLAADLFGRVRKAGRGPR